jgi:putative endonuclease
VYATVLHWARPKLIVVPAKAGTHNHRRKSSRKIEPNMSATGHISTGTYYVYILASGPHGTLYIGVTNNLRTRLEQHRTGRGSEFVKKYSVHRLVHVEAFTSPRDAIAREKQLKNWHRDWKIRLIEKENLDWSDLSGLL